MTPKAKPQPPATHEDLTETIEARFEKLSRSHRQIARYLIQNPSEVAIQSVNGIAERCGVHASSLVRFAQALGYSGFKELQTIFHDRLATTAPGFEARIDALKEELDLELRPGALGVLTDIVARDIAALRGLPDDLEEADFQTAACLLARARTVFLAGRQRSEPIASFLRFGLTMLGRPVVPLDAGGGLTTQTLRLLGPADAVVAVALRPYPKQVVAVSEAAAIAGTPVVAITDTRLSPLAKSARALFTVPDDQAGREDQVGWGARSLAAPVCLCQALMVAVAARMEQEKDRGEVPAAKRS